MMISFFVIRHIYARAKEKKLDITGDLVELLRTRIELYKKSQKKIIFSWLWDGGSKVPNASASIPRVILFNAEWAARIVLYPDDEDMHRAFRLTMGHEITHQENDYFFLEPFTKNEKFVYWVNEVHADFGGIVKAFGGNSMLGLMAMEYKKDSKILENREDKDTFMHPSWERRMRFVRDYNFDAELIRDIAAIVGCKNEKLISKVIKHFDTITLSKE